MSGLFIQFAKVVHTASPGKNRAVPARPGIVERPCLATQYLTWPTAHLQAADFQPEADIQYLFRGLVGGTLVACHETHL
jgi:hypothetical protein